MEFHQKQLEKDYNSITSALESENVSHSVMSDSLQPHELQPTRLLCPQGFSKKNTGVGCCFLLQGIFPFQGSNPGLPHCRRILCQLSHQGSPGLFPIWSFNGKNCGECSYTGICKHKFLFLWDKCPIVQLLGHMVIVCLMF